MTATNILFAFAGYIAGASCMLFYWISANRANRDLDEHDEMERRWREERARQMSAGRKENEL